MKHYSAVTIDYEFFDECGSGLICIWFDSRVRRMKRKLTIIGIIKVSGISEFLIYHYQSKHHKALNGALSGQFASDFPAFFPHFISFNLIFWLDESDFQVLFRFNWARFDSLLSLIISILFVLKKHFRTSLWTFHLIQWDALVYQK